MATVRKCDRCGDIGAIKERPVDGWGLNVMVARLECGDLLPDRRDLCVACNKEYLSLRATLDTNFMANLHGMSISLSKS